MDSGDGEADSSLRRAPRSPSQSTALSDSGDNKDKDDSENEDKDESDKNGKDEDDKKGKEVKPNTRWHILYASVQASFQISSRAKRWLPLLLVAELESIKSYLFDAPAIAEIVSRDDNGGEPGFLELADEALQRAAFAYCFARDIRFICDNFGTPGQNAVAKALANAVRDVVTWRNIRLNGVTTQDEYTMHLNNAFNGALSVDRSMKAQLLKSFHTVVGRENHTFQSRNAQRARKRKR